MNTPQFGAPMPQHPGYRMQHPFGPPGQPSFNGMDPTSGMEPQMKHGLVSNGPPISNGPAPREMDFHQKPSMPAPGPNQISQQMAAMRISQPRPPGTGGPAQWPSGGPPNSSFGQPGTDFGPPQPPVGAMPPSQQQQFPPPGYGAPTAHFSGPPSGPPVPGPQQVPPPGSGYGITTPNMQQQIPPSGSVYGAMTPGSQPMPPSSGGYGARPQLSHMPPGGAFQGSQAGAVAPNMSSLTRPSLGPGAPHMTQSNVGHAPPMAGGMPRTSRNNGPSQSYGQYPPMQGRYPPGQQHPQQFSQPQPGMAPQQPHPGGVAPQQQQARRLDPDQMPSPIQVIEDDKKQRSGTFFSNTKGQVPPLVTTDFVVQDEGVSSPRFMRSTIYNVPCLPDMLKQTAVPFAVSICPFARLAEGEMQPPISDLGEIGPVRCIRCKAYMCAFMQFIDGGRRFQCVFCKATTEVPPEYFAHLDHTGQRTDKFQKPELCLGSYEFVATKEYCRKDTLPNSPAFIFAIEVSFNSISSGILSILCSNMKTLLASLPKEAGAEKSAVRVGFITYNSVVHFYNVKGNLAQPQMLVVSDVSDMFVPLLDGFLVTLDEAEEVIDSLLEQIPLMFAECRETETVLGPVIQAGLEALKAADCAGKLFVFHTSLPIAEAPGKLKNRDDRKLLGTEKEKTILTPQNAFYNTLGQDCVAAACCVDLFLFPNGYVDVATIGQVCRLTGGEIYKYAFFKALVDGPQFLADLKRDIEKPIAFDAIMRVRTSAGIRPTDFYGNYFMSNTTDVELAAVDCDKALSVEIKYDDKLAEEEGAFLQVAVLYTSCGGQRRLRVHNLALNTCAAMADLYRSCELDTIVNYFAKQGLRLLMEQMPRAVKDGFVSRSAQILASYRKHCASPSSAGQLILPECMKLLPLYINCLIKSDALAGGSDLSTDDRSFAMMCVNSMDVSGSVGYFYPRLLCLHDVDPEATDMPPTLRCTAEKLRENGVYLLENGIYMFLWIGQSIAPDWLKDVFAVQSPAQIDIEKPNLIELNTPLSLRVRDIIERVRMERRRHMKLVLVRQGDKLEIVFRQFLVEDRGSDGSTSYVDFLCHLHKEIRTLLT